MAQDMAQLCDGRAMIAMASVAMAGIAMERDATTMEWITMASAAMVQIAMASAAMVAIAIAIVSAAMEDILVRSDGDELSASMAVPMASAGMDAIPFASAALVQNEEIADVRYPTPLTFAKCHNVCQTIFCRFPVLTLARNEPPHWVFGSVGNCASVHNGPSHLASARNERLRCDYCA
ncbi:hypothetical protein CBR_g46808 [Chara braunii]|uniref:Uncharacterized protein n=1 Tax=Chara braunii TaxID=69332 RepID=A0A388M123_CHABU|nr:hypothetical protein CBR_g46808 [Chara braunii]|eukprot:GBG88241.1 hypothetical protein CBR_g46808 [Chara braunii]